VVRGGRATPHKAIQHVGKGNRPSAAPPAPRKLVGGKMERGFCDLWGTCLQIENQKERRAMSEKKWGGGKTSVT